ncbi:MAG: HAD family hydrolase [Candidatus Izemoplasmataceae bacterium]
MKLAIYDFDGTLIQKHAIPSILNTWKKLGLNRKVYKKIRRKIILLYIAYKLKIFGIKKEVFRVKAMHIMQKLFASVDFKTAKDTLYNVYLDLSSSINQAVLKAMEIDKDNGYTCILLSGNYLPILEPFKSLGFDKVIGTKLYQNETIIPYDDIDILIHNKKKEALLNAYKDADLRASKVYADSYYDLPLFELVGIKIAVNPDEALKKYAIKNGFTII